MMLKRTLTEVPSSELMPRMAAGIRFRRSWASSRPMLCWMKLRSKCRRRVELVALYWSRRAATGRMILEAGQRRPGSGSV